MSDITDTLIIEDVRSLAMVHAEQLGLSIDEVQIACSLAEAREALAARSYALILLDLQLPDGDGLEFLHTLLRVSPNSTVIIITADASINRAIEAMRIGAADYLVKPIQQARLRTTVSNAMERSRLRRAVSDITGQNKKSDVFHGFVGSSAPMKVVYQTIDNVAPSKATVLITGESGTGKEVCARALHNAGNRAHGPFIAVNCGAIPKDLIESELFGHMKGSFTGAISDRPGAVRSAHGGTLFLDEIGEMAPDSQTKLLRFLHSSRVTPVGSTKAETVDIRVVCATNRDPAADVAAGRFREDLFYRLNVIPIHMPPLRDRGGDIVEIARAFLHRFGREEGRQFEDFSAEAVSALLAYHWPGNVRELQNVVRRVAVMCDGGIVQAIDLPIALTANNIAAQRDCSDTETAVGDAPILIGKPLREIERTAIEATIAACNGSIPKAARILGVSPSTIYRKQEGWSRVPA